MRQDNRREHLRFATSLSVEIFTNAGVVLAAAQNVSVGGLGVESAEPLPEGQPVGLSMFLVEDGIEDGTTEPLNLKGHVMWCTPSERGAFLAGVRFDALAPQHQMLLNHFLARLNAG